jgi:hypothetical protein
VKKLIQTLKNIWEIDELKKKIIYTLLLILIYRVGSHIVLPGIDPNIRSLLGNYIQIYTNSGLDKYILSLVTSPCGTGTNPLQQIPLANCSLISPIGPLGYANDQPCCFVYNGGTGATGAYLNPGAYWGKSNCDSEMIELTNALNLKFTPIVKGR